MPTYSDELRRLAKMLDDDFHLPNLKIVCDELDVILMNLIRERDRMKNEPI